MKKDEAQLAKWTYYEAVQSILDECSTNVKLWGVTHAPWKSLIRLALSDIIGIQTNKGNGSL